MEICRLCGLHLGGPVAARYVLWGECAHGTGCKVIPWWKRLWRVVRVAPTKEERDDGK